MLWLLSAIACGAAAYSLFGVLGSGIAGPRAAVIVLLAVGMSVAMFYCLGRWWTQAPPDVLGTRRGARRPKLAPAPVLAFRSNGLGEVVLALVSTAGTICLWSLQADFVILWLLQALVSWVNAIRALRSPTVRLEADAIVVRGGLLGGGARIPYDDVQRIERDGSRLTLCRTRPPHGHIPLSTVRREKRLELIDELLQRCRLSPPNVE
jgi:hypothetical protein